MNWLWLNVPLAALFFLAWTLIPLWMVVKHPDTGSLTPGPERRAADHATAAADPVPAPHSPAPAALPGWAHSHGTGRRPGPAGHRAHELAAAAREPAPSQSAMRGRG